jgi:hypothetical protein
MRSCEDFPTETKTKIRYTEIAMKHATFFPWFKDEGEVVASFGQAQLVRFLDSKCVLRGGSEEDRTAAKKWISLFWRDRVVQEG